jgi:site-specific DNA recombinase
MKRPTAIYARVSSDRQKEAGTIGSQTMLLREYAEAHDLQVPSEWIFEDEGYTGATLARPGLERLRDLTVEGQLEVVLVYSPDRLSRKYAYQVLLTEEFSRHGVQVIFLKSSAGETPEERLMQQFQGMIAEYERAQIAERTRRGKRYRAKAGCVNVLCGAPYGYRYVKKSEHSQAFYEVLDAQAEVVRKIFGWYTQELWSIGAIARKLNEQDVPTRFGRALWERSTVWGILRNPAYAGSACFGKTELCARRRITRSLRQKGGFSRRSSSSREKDRSQWIEIAVPALVSQQTFALAQERLAQNKQLSQRNTREPTLLQGLLVCEQCGYALYRTSTRTTRRQIKYYRCLGSDRYRHLRGPACSCRPIRQEYLDELVWQELLRLLRTPQLIEAELERRRTASLNGSPVPQRQEQVQRELTRLGQQMDKLLDAYQEGLMALGDLRKRSPEIRKRIGALEQEQQNLKLRAVEDKRWIELNNSMEGFLNRLNQTAQRMTTLERQKVLRTLVRQITVGKDLITIHHSIPVGVAGGKHESASYPLCTRGHNPALRCSRLGVDDLAVLLQHPRPQPFADEVHKGSIRDSLLQHPLQPLPPDVVKESLDVCFYHEVVPAKLQLPRQVLNGIVCPHPWPVAVAARQKCPFVYRQQDLGRCHLQQLILQHQYPQGP